MVAGARVAVGTATPAELAKARARELLAGVFAAELAELEEIEAERAAAERHGERLRAELAAAGRDLDAIRDALAALPGEIQAAQLEADHLAEAEIQERHARLSARLREAEDRHAAARAEHDRDAMTPLQAAQRASQRAWAVKTRAEALAPAVAAELKAALEPVLEGSRRASSLAHTLQAYR